MPKVADYNSHDPLPTASSHDLLLIIRTCWRSDYSLQSHYLSALIIGLISACFTFGFPGRTIHAFVSQHIWLYDSFVLLGFVSNSMCLRAHDSPCSLKWLVIAEHNPVTVSHHQQCHLSCVAQSLMSLRVVSVKTVIPVDDPGSEWLEVLHR